MNFFKSKKISKYLVALISPFIIMTSVANAGPRTDTAWEDVNWTQYNLKFSLPSDLKETENTTTKYIAENKSLTFEIYPWKDNTVNEHDVAQAAFEDLGLDKKGLKITSDKKRNLNGFSGYEILGEGFLNGKGVNFAVLGFIDPNSSNNFAAYILYWQDGDETKNIEVERDIIESIMPLKK
ncbi:MAG: hypothetical protein U0457_11010 [Candidatus Sericytochromatia bacterium]